MATKKSAAPKAETAVPAATVAKPKKATAKAETAPTEITVTKAPKKAATKATTTKVTFTLPKEAVQTAKTVAVVGEFNNWDIVNGTELKKQKDGSFSTTLELETGKEYQYRFLINGEIWENAWDAPKYVETSFGTYNSVVLA
jgi:1,4-alpha-glucan branching enzyme